MRRRHAAAHFGQLGHSGVAPPRAGRARTGRGLVRRRRGAVHRAGARRAAGPSAAGAHREVADGGRALPAGGVLDVHGAAGDPRHRPVGHGLTVAVDDHSDRVHEIKSTASVLVDLHL